MRVHIRVEQQLKLHIENLQSKIEEYEKQAVTTSDNEVVDPRYLQSVQRLRKQLAAKEDETQQLQAAVQEKIEMCQQLESRVQTLVDKCGKLEAQLQILATKSKRPEPLQDHELRLSLDPLNCPESSKTLLNVSAEEKLHNFHADIGQLKRIGHFADPVRLSSIL